MKSRDTSSSSFKEALASQPKGKSMEDAPAPVCGVALGARPMCNLSTFERILPQGPRPQQSPKKSKNKQEEVISMICLFKRSKGYRGGAVNDLSAASMADAPNRSAICGSTGPQLGQRALPSTSLRSSMPAVNEKGQEHTPTKTGINAGGKLRGKGNNALAGKMRPSPVKLWEEAELGYQDAAEDASPESQALDQFLEYSQKMIPPLHLTMLKPERPR
ncbi:hypothetical protein CEUSTIGMA_g9962.t1 [Chlamydomonas eustigma]|uniref:Uncharacterized protein n=1 Tax=Chlamydomonas eustigma TaxID=1157962 RepID=A0A250XHH8_9CHLO|nr:hypothetical protein CEUSTIGMA_g9962.t1 [Chlamydomonas eustigma]|eukprot:GAX82535.1 hypothetical protein CEUSTIGMA_g9962.t1 [Chlamydomonas eustigma]